MSKQVLDISQMQHLKDLGVDTSNASACWFRVLGIGDLRVFTIWSLAFNKYITKTDGIDTQIVPTFTLQDILDLLPKEMVDKDDDKFVLKVEYGITRKVWYIGYYYYDVTFYDLLFSGENLIDAAYGMLCWCVENGYVETNKED